MWAQNYAGANNSSLERTFAQEFMDFESKFGGVRGHWHLSRESDILLLERTIMLPDFTLVHETDPNRKILLELVGFWTPRYLRTKLAKIREANCSHLLVLVYERLNVTHEDFDGVSSEILFFKEKPVLKEVMAAVEAMADRVYGPLTPQRKHVGTSPSSPLLADQVRIGMTQRRLTAREWMPLVHLHDALLSADPSFAPRLYGAATLHDLVVSSPDLFEIRRSSSRGRPWQVRVCLSRRSQEEKQDE